MDRVNHLRPFQTYFFYGIWILLFTCPSSGGVSFMPPESVPPLRAGESYPESRFGESPARIQLGTNSGYANRMMEESNLEENEPHSRSLASRSPAGKAESENRDSGSSSLSESPMEVVPSSSGSQGSVSRKGVQEVAVIAGDLGFFPKTVFLTRDVPVRFFVTGASKNTLCIMMDSFQVRRQIRSQKIEEITFVPHTPGKYRFYCPVNGMEGTLVVREFVSRLPSEGAR